MLVISAASDQRAPCRPKESSAERAPSALLAAALRGGLVDAGNILDRARGLGVGRVPGWRRRERHHVKRDRLILGDDLEPTSAFTHRRRPCKARRPIELGQEAVADLRKGGAEGILVRDALSARLIGRRGGASRQQARNGPEKPAERCSHRSFLGTFHRQISYPTGG